MRPSKLTPDLQSEYLQALRSGCSRRDAAGYVGVHYDTVGEWFRRGADPEADSLYREFRRMVVKTERTVKLRLLGFLQKAAEGDWKAAAWFLERKYSREWGKHNALTVEANVKAHVTTDEQVEALLHDPDTRDLLDQLALRTATHGLAHAPGSRPPSQPSGNGNGHGGVEGAP